MRFEGTLKKEGRFWIVEVPVLGVMTQGKSRKEALLMIGDAIETLTYDCECAVTVHPGVRERFEVSGSNTSVMIALALSNLRRENSLSLGQVAARLGRLSRNAFARYESGDVTPTITKLEELLKAIDPKRDLVIGLSRS